LETTGQVPVELATKREQLLEAVVADIDISTTVTQLEMLDNSFATTSCPLSSFAGLSAADDFMQVVGPLHVNTSFTMNNASMVIQAELFVDTNLTMEASGLMMLNTTTVSGVVGLEAGSMVWVRDNVLASNLNLDSSSNLDFSGSIIEARGSSSPMLTLNNCPTWNGKVSLTLTLDQVSRVNQGENITLLFADTPCEPVLDATRFIARFPNGSAIGTTVLESEMTTTNRGDRWSLSGLFSTSYRSSNSNSDDTPSSSIAGPGSLKSSSNKNAIIIGCTIGGVALLALLAGVILLRVPSVRKVVFPYRRTL
jgi:hypothetical protein